MVMVLHMLNRTSHCVSRAACPIRSLLAGILLFLSRGLGFKNTIIRIFPQVAHMLLVSCKNSRK